VSNFCRKTSVAEFNRATAPINSIKEKTILQALKYCYTKPHQNLPPSEWWPPPDEVSSGAVRRRIHIFRIMSPWRPSLPTEVILSNRVDWTNSKSICLRKFPTLCSSIGLFYGFCLKELTMGEQHKVNQDTWPITLWLPTAKPAHIPLKQSCGSRSIGYSKSIIRRSTWWVCILSKSNRTNWCLKNDYRLTFMGVHPTAMTPLYRGIG